MAAHLAIRLEELNDSETNRPYVHYWREYLSRGEACADLRVRRSPLAKGKRHKLILAHFQIDDHGRVASPEPWAHVQMDSIQFSDPTAGDRRRYPGPPLAGARLADAGTADPGRRPGRQPGPPAGRRGGAGDAVPLADRVVRRASRR